MKGKDRKPSLSELRVLIKGAGEMASGIAWRLFRSHLHVCMTELARPAAVRRPVSFCEAVYEDQQVVEGVEGILVEASDDVLSTWKQNKIPILVDPDCRVRENLKPHCLVDAILAKKNTGTHLGDADLVVALGPGFVAGVDADMVVETNRGHRLGQILTDGEADPNTGIPGDIGGYTWQRVLRAPSRGIFLADRGIGDLVEEGAVVGYVDGNPVMAGVKGVIRGLIRPETPVPEGFKLGDIDPRGERSFCYTISDKARALGGSVLEAIMRAFNK
jgi:xanthine dehydrogenase accessory factor